MRVGDVVVIDRTGLDQLVAALAARGMRTVGPVVRDEAICHGDVAGAADLPEGWHDEQSPGSYRIHRDDDPRFFAWAVGPQSLKHRYFPATEVVWRSGAQGARPGPADAAHADLPPTVAVIGARPCELAALGVLDAVFAQGAIADPSYTLRRDGTFAVVADCATPAGTCFCASMGTGPSAESGFDLALSELADDHGHRFVVRVGTERAADVADELAWRPASDGDLAAAAASREAARVAMTRSLDTDDLPGLLARALDHPRWDEVADRCLACGNCTLVCPTCFCSTIEDTSDLSGSLERRRRWASCFEERHSYMHGGPVRESTRARYRQWLTHKLGTWHDQFGMSGCVGCGRCIAWCPVGIDITEEVAAIRADERVDAGGSRP